MATADAIPVIKVLFTLHAGMDAMDFIGPLEVLSSAQHNINDPCELTDRSQALNRTIFSLQTYTSLSPFLSPQANNTY
jgi:hypothetical protein